MKTRTRVLVMAAAIAAAACGQEAPKSEAPKPPAAPVAPAPPAPPKVRVYVTNEASGDLTVIDASTQAVIATAPLGKRPRGIKASPDGKTLYVALSGSPSAPPGTDESKLPPPDRTADGIGVFDVRRNKLVRVLPSGTDPEQVDLSKEGSLLYVSKEDAATTSSVDLAAAAIRETPPRG